MNSNVAGLLTILVLILLVVGICYLNDWLIDAVARWRNPPEKVAADRRAYDERLLRPDWEFYERHLQRSAPAGLRALYSNPSLLLKESHDYDEFHTLAFCALDEKGRDECFSWMRLDIVPIADSDSNLVYLRPGATESDAVWITYHDGHDTEKLAPDFSAFYERLMAANGPAGTEGESPDEERSRIG